MVAEFFPWHSQVHLWIYVACWKFHSTRWMVVWVNFAVHLFRVPTMWYVGCNWSVRHFDFPWSIIMEMLQCGIHISIHWNQTTKYVLMGCTYDSKMNGEAEKEKNRTHTGARWLYFDGNENLRGTGIDAWFQKVTKQHIPFHSLSSFHVEKRSPWHSTVCDAALFLSGIFFTPPLIWLTNFSDNFQYASKACTLCVWHFYFFFYVHFFAAGFSSILFTGGWRCIPEFAYPTKPRRVPTSKCDQKPKIIGEWGTRLGEVGTIPI